MEEIRILVVIIITSGYYGEWIKIQLPQSIILKSYSINTTNTAGIRITKL
jgi:hypothetical protein